MEEKIIESKKDISSYAKAFAFLAIEILAVLAFNLGNSFIFYSVLSFLILILVLFVTFKQINKDGIATFAFYLFPLFLFGFLTAISQFKITNNYILGNGGLTFLLPFALIAIASAGFLVTSTKSFNINVALIVIYSALALLVLINFIVTIIQFCPFYTLLYKGKYIYYAGSRSEVTIDKMAYALKGFTFEEVSINYYTLFPSILMSAIVVPFFTKFKNNKKIFVLFLSYFLLGFIAILFSITKYTLIPTVIILAALIFLILTAKKIINFSLIKILIGILIALFVIYFLVLFIYSQNIMGSNIAIPAFRNFIDGNSILKRIFVTNYYSSNYILALDGVVSSQKALGWPLGTWTVGSVTFTLNDTNSIIFNTFITSGVFGFLALALFVILFYKSIVKYLKTSSDTLNDKTLLTSFLLVSFIYLSINGTMSSNIFDKSIEPFYVYGLCFVILFLFGYVFASKIDQPKEVIANEQN